MLASPHQTGSMSDPLISSPSLSAPPPPSPPPPPPPPAAAAAAAAVAACGSATSGEVAASSSSLPQAGPSSKAPAKPMVVRIKRKRYQAPIESLWLEVSDRPTKRLESSFSGLELTGRPTKQLESETSSLSLSTIHGESVEAKPARLLFHHLETVNSFGTEETYRVESRLKEFQVGTKRKHDRFARLKDPKGKNLMKAMEAHQGLTKAARFKQLWTSRRESKNMDFMSKAFRLYDVVRVDMDTDAVEEQRRYEQAMRDAELEEVRSLQDFLPLFKEYLPSAAAEIESSVAMSQKHGEDEYVYDVYALEEGASIIGDNEYPIVQVLENEFGWGLSSESEYDSEDSNAENNPLNDYPEEDSEDEGMDTETDTNGLASEDDNQTASSDAAEGHDSEFFEDHEGHWSDPETDFSHENSDDN